MNKFPEAKLPSFNTPTIRGLPSIPKVGCVSGKPTTLIGEQMGNLPDINALPHVKALKKVIEEQIGTLLEGKLPQIARSPLYEIRQARLVGELAEMVQKATELAGSVLAELDAAIDFANSKISDLNSAINEINETSAELRTAVQKKALDRYNEYIGEINEQIGRLEAAKGCLF